MLESLACGVPVAGFPVMGPKDVLVPAGVGAVDDDLARAVERARSIDRARCRAFAEASSWEQCSRRFLDLLVAAPTAAAKTKQRRARKTAAVASAGEQPDAADGGRPAEAESALLAARARAATATAAPAARAYPVTAAAAASTTAAAAGDIKVQSHDRVVELRMCAVDAETQSQP